MPGSDDTQADPRVVESALADAQERNAITLSQRGDRMAFNELVLRHQSAAYGLALRMLGDPDAAADVTQDAFFAAFRNIRSLRGMSFRAWLLRIVSNGCHDYWRAQRRRPTESLDALLAGSADANGPSAPDADLAQALRDGTWNPEGAALRAEQIEAIEAAVLRLAPDQRLVIILSDIQGLSYEDIARVAGTPLGTVKSRIARARARLREVLLGQSELFPRAERHDVRNP
ncbi:MAG TPA: sigma-70 family RNA polymerase sigma factor [Ktedonobacterales bacterium]|jgi:RNA polymerase sigma-70 factor (ECF subfamily)|nr:sigma-70 family RNA polymerase sigma factor [Ktedonobacterales bacterium]